MDRLLLFIYNGQDRLNARITPSMKLIAKLKK